MNAWVLDLEGRSGLLVASLWDPSAGAQLATASVDVAPGEREALLPGSSVRGVLRDALRRFAEARTGQPCTWQPGSADSACSCPACILFGAPNRPGKLRVSSALAPAAWLTHASVAIDRDTRTAFRGVDGAAEAASPQRGGSLWTERRARASFTVEVRSLNELEPSERQLLEGFFAWLEATGLSVGQRKSAGAGAFDVRVRNGPVPGRATPRLGAGRGTRRRYACRITLLEPAHVVGPRQRDFYRDGLEVIPASTVRGALGWAVEFAAGPAVARELFLSDRPVLVGPAFLVEPDGPTGRAVPWASRRRCTAAHLVDLALAQTVAVFGEAPPPVACPRCGAPLKPAGAPQPPTLVLGHTAINPRTRRAEEAQLHYEVALAPRSTFEAQLVATEEQAEVIGKVQELLVGGRRARGMGRASVELAEVSLPPLGERLAATARALSDRGVQLAEPVALLGLLSDAAPGGPLGDLLRARGLRPLTGELRTVERGGWDELAGRQPGARAAAAGRPRGLREVLAAGSWVAVACDDPAHLEELEREGVEDPEEICPLIVTVRWDLEEVVDVPEGATKVEARGAERDQLVREVRERCRRHRNALPKSAQLHNLLRYAQQTDSVEEVALFFEYQASRKDPEFRRIAPFLKELAQVARQQYAAKPEPLRDYLALVVRAAHVEHPEGGKGD